MMYTIYCWRLLRSRRTAKLFTGTGQWGIEEKIQWSTINGTAKVTTQKKKQDAIFFDMRKQLHAVYMFLIEQYHMSDIAQTFKQ